MKPLSLKPRTLSLLALSLCLTSVSANPDARLRSEANQALKSVVLPEIPPTAAQWVKNAPRQHKRAAALAALNEAVRLNPPSAVSVVGALTETVPEHAAAIAERAVELQPENWIPIVRAAVRGAPEYALKIMSVLAKEYPLEMPKSYHAVRLAVPDQEALLFQSVIDSAPGLKSILGAEQVERAGRVLANKKAASLKPEALGRGVDVAKAAAEAFAYSIVEAAAGEGLDPGAVREQINVGEIVKEIAQGRLPIPNSDGGNGGEVNDAVSAYAAPILSPMITNMQNGNTRTTELNVQNRNVSVNIVKQQTFQENGPTLTELDITIETPKKTITHHVSAPRNYASP